MSVDRNEVVRIARLARLELEAAEADRLTDEMNRILEHAERLRTADAGDAGGPPASPPTTPSDSIEGARGGETVADGLRSGPADFAPAWADGFFLVPPPPGVTAGDEE